MDEISALDLGVIAGPNGLDIAEWRALSPARQGNALRAWLKASCGAPASASLVQRLLGEVALQQSARWLVAGGELRSYRGRLRFDALASQPVVSSPERESGLSVLRAGSHALPGWGGVLNVRRVKEGGVPLAWLAHLSLQARAGAERFQAGLGRPPRSLKKQYQAAGLPAWQREGPLVYAGGQLVFVPGLGLDARVIGLPGQAQVTLDWQPG
jgi:tRNA(Ile)-lysidine synthase